MCSSLLWYIRVTTGRSNKSAFIAKNATRGRQSGGCISSSYCRAATDGSYSQPASQLMVVATTAAATATETAVAIAMQQAVQRGTRYIVSNGKSGNRRQSKCCFFQQSNNQAVVKARRASIPIRAMQGQCLSFNRSGGCMGNSDCSVSSGGCIRQQSLVDNRRN